jgi:hypothetical protein
VILCPQLRRFAEEHARWLAALERAGEDGERAAALLALWDAEILAHCRREEDVLLPELARRIPEADAVIVFTLGDHVALRRLARELREATGRAAGGAAARLRARLAEHLAFEERTLFPALQDALGCDRLAALAPELGRAGAAPPVDRPRAPRTRTRTRTPTRRGTKP